MDSESMVSLSFPTKHAWIMEIAPEIYAVDVEHFNTMNSGAIWGMNNVSERTTYE